MLGISGFELYRFIKKNLVHEKVTIVICSSKNQAIHRLWVKKQGADAYITKLYTPEQLLSIVQSLEA
nr:MULTISPECIES: hypothetical protein [Nostoc]